MSRGSERGPSEKLGIGLIYSPALDGFLERRPDAVDVIEVEPQTYWLADHPVYGPFHPMEPVERLIERHSHRRLIHSVGCPLGGLRKPSEEQGKLLRDLAERWHAPWVSEHLSIAGTHHEQAGFLLPPRQTPAGVAVAARNAALFRQMVARPVLVEVGVNYLRATAEELADAEFIAAVSVAADCGILLDLHNAYCNERNGRGSLEAFVSRLPAERILEIHLAGGLEHEGYWLDAHSGSMPADLVLRARDLVQGLPNVAAIIFEIYPSYLDKIGEDQLLRILDEVRSVWANVGCVRGDGDPRWLEGADPIASNGHTLPVEEIADDDDVLAWETRLTLNVSGRDSEHSAERMLSNDPALPLYRTLVASFRGSMLLRTLPLTVRYLFDVYRNTVFLEGFYADVAPQLYSILEAREFVAHIASNSNDPILTALSSYELAIAETQIDGRSRVVAFPGDPSELFSALKERRTRPDQLPPPRWEIEIVADETVLPTAGRVGLS